MSPSIDVGLLRAFERALADHRLHLSYQPKVHLADGTVDWVEALVRWDDPAIGNIPPSRFVPLAEQHGWIDDLTVWGLRTMFSQWEKWADAGLDCRISFNISALSLQHLDFPDLVEQLCGESGMPADRLVLELTEGATQPLIKLMDTLTRFRIKGIGLAIDDFGTGYSSLLQLRQLPFTELKIDREFIKDVDRASDCRIIVKAQIDLAHALGLTATAEGVENLAQFRLLRDLGCDHAQGYVIAPALMGDDLIQWIGDFEHRWPALAESTLGASSA